VGLQRLADVKKGAKASRARVLLSLTVFYYCSTAWIWALDPGHRISQYGHTAWRIQDGYFGGRLSAVTQTTDGYLWIGTEAGLLRFDGVRFVPWSPPMGQQLPSSRIRSLLGARDGSLWIGTHSGLGRWADQKLVNLDIHGAIGSILESRDGAVWLVYGDPHHTPLCRVAETAVRCYEEADGIPDEANGSIIRDAVGNLWIGAQHGVTRWQPGSFSVHDVSALRSLEGVDGVEAVAVAADGSILVGMAMPGRGLGLQQLVQGAWKPFEKPGLDGAQLTVATLFVDRQNALWIGTLQQGIYRVYGQTVEHFDMSDGLSGNYVRNFYEDRESNLWVVTSKGVDLFHDLPVVTFSTREGLGTEEVESVLASRDGTIWVGGAESLDAIRPSGVSSLRTGKGLVGSQVGALFEDHAGQLWVGVDQTLSIYKKGSLRQISRADGGPIGEVTSITEDKENNIWAEILHESVRRLVRIHDFRIQQEFPAPQLPAARQVVADPEGSLWLGLVDGHLARVRNGQAVTFHFEQTRDTPIEQLMLGSDGSLLGATADGVVGWKNGKPQVLTTRNGLPCNGAHGLIDDAHGNLWLNLQCGIVQVARSEVQEWWEKPDIVVHPTVFDTYDGAQPGRAVWESAARSGDGRLWFANGSVLQMIDPDHLARNVAGPPVHVEEIVADRKHYHPQNGLRIPPLPRDLELDYTALSFAVPQKVRFRYKLEGRDAGWQDAGTRRQAFYNDLRPGDYRFRVTACNNSGVWNDAGAFLEFSIVPAYYQTAWFRLSCVGVFLATLWALYQLRLQQLHRQFNIGLEARVNERTRIARDLHDTLLQSLHGLMFQFQAARNLLPRRPDEAMQSLDDAIDETERALGESRDAIRDLRSEPIARGDLAELLMATSQNMAASERANDKSPIFNLIVEGERRTLAPMVENEVYRISLEIMRNAFRHANAQRIEAEIRYDDHTLRLRIRDDGKGIDPKVLKDGGPAGHWGLRGVRERAERIGARLDFWSEVGAGTEVQLAVPSAVAYEESRGRALDQD
jgi:signal transduction histidine kinase/ligand-binding sensor domain-containing protein